MPDEEESESSEESEGSGGGSKKLIIIIVLVVLVLGGGGAGAFFALSGSSEESGEDGEDEGDEEEDDELSELPGAVYPLDTFIVNLRVKGSFLKTEIQLEFYEPELPPTMDADMPKIRDAIIKILSGKTASEILNAEGKEQLREDLKNTVNEALGAEEVVALYFTDFIVQ